MHARQRVHRTHLKNIQSLLQTGLYQVIPKAAKSVTEPAVLRKSFLEYDGDSIFDFIDKLYFLISYDQQ